MEQDRFDRYLHEFLPEEGASRTFPSMAEFLRIVQYLPNWKACGVDGVYNFFLKKFASLHSFLYEVVRKVCLEGQVEAPWFYRGITYLIPKGTPTRGGDFRPITCMSNLYKLTTRCVNAVLTLEVEARGLLAENQLGTVRGVQGAKEQAMLNIALNRAHGNNLRAAWIDVKKAYDSVEHTYLLRCLEKLNLPPWILRFLTDTICRWELDVVLGGEHVLAKKVERGILQGDSLSPLLFVLCVDPLSRALNARFPVLTVPAGDEHHVCNHLLFVDDLKLFAESDEVLAALLEEVKTFFRSIGLEMNREKSATNSAACAEDAVLIEGAGVYKYLGIVEDASGAPTEQAFESVRRELVARAERLCKTKLSGKNLFKALNEHALSLLNYHIGVLQLEPGVFERLDREIRRILVANGVHKQPACTERLYLPRAEMGRGLCSAEHKSERMLLDLRASLAASRASSTRRAAILKVEEDGCTHLALIESYLRARYGLEGPVTGEALEVAQKGCLYSELRKKTLHSKLYRCTENPNVDLRESSTWLLHGNMSARDEGALCALQDRNLFLGAAQQCHHCRQALKTVDHLATRCDRMLSHDYMRRHNEALRSLHLLMCNAYGIRRTCRIRSHSVQSYAANDHAVIWVDTIVKTNVKVQNNRPDMVVFDRRRKEILIVEVGITSQEQLQTVEAEKARKYDLLAGELTNMHGWPVRIIPYVMTWEGVVTNYHRRFLKQLNVPTNVQAYIQYRVLKKTLESVSFDRRRGIEERVLEEEADAMLERMLQAGDVGQSA